MLCLCVTLFWGCPWLFWGVKEGVSTPRPRRKTVGAWLLLVTPSVQLGGIVYQRGGVVCAVPSPADWLERGPHRDPHADWWRRAVVAPPCGRAGRSSWDETGTGAGLGERERDRDRSGAGRAGRGPGLEPERGLAAAAKPPRGREVTGTEEMEAPGTGWKWGWGVTGTG